MQRLIINGGRRLGGEIRVQGAKNSALPILAGCVLAGEEVKLYNIPELSDVFAALRILSCLGVRKATFILDKPVSNSGSLKQLILELSKNYNIDVDAELNMNPDLLFVDKENVISSDGPVLQRSFSWYNLNSMVIRRMIPDAWIFDFKYEE